MLLYPSHRQGRVEGGAMAPPLRSPNFTLDRRLSQKKVRERCLIGQKTRVGPPPRAFSKHAPGYSVAGLLGIIWNCIEL